MTSNLDTQVTFKSWTHPTTGEVRIYVNGFGFEDTVKVWFEDAASLWDGIKFRGSELRDRNYQGCSDFKAEAICEEVEAALANIGLPDIFKASFSDLLEAIK